MTEPQSRFIPIGDLLLHVLDWGGAPDRILILLHGLASTVHMFDLIAADFTDRYHVYALDQRGHGLSDKPDSGYDFETVSVDLDRLLDVLNPGGLPVAVVGHSWGAYTALYYAATRSVDRVVLLDGGVRPLTDLFPTWAEGEVGLAPPVYKDVTLRQMQSYIEHVWLKGAYRPDIGPLALSIFDTSNPTDVHARLNRPNNMQIAYALWAFRPGDYFARVSCPALVVAAVAEGDDLSLLMQQRLEQARDELPKGRLVIMRDTIHDIPWHRPRELVALLREFL